MRILDALVRFFVGGLFIFSGLIKVNDPIGTAIKLEEYFEVFATDFSAFFHVFVPWSLPMSVVFSVLEVVLGVAVLVKFRMRLTAWLLLLLIVFFTFLTFYSWHFDKVTDCGCFGDAIPLDPRESFFKDLILLVLIIFIFWRRHHYSSVFSTKITDAIVAGVLVINVALALYSIAHLPYIDFRPYHVGADIQQKMQPSAPYRYEYLMEKDGETLRFDAYPPDTTLKFKEMVLLNPEAQPEITDYNVWNDEGDFTAESYEGTKLLVIFTDVHKARTRHLDELRHLIEELSNRVDVWVLTANSQAVYENFRHEYQIAAPYFFADGTVLKAMIRANPGLILLQDGVVQGKWHSNDLPSPAQVVQLSEK
jgi:uncharacterized membrane protein YphA (DoxX/SURF4 family)